ncbi:hypothetical protein IC229_04215 [Spirosoma sp. BT702]|uniref:Uncharacterized protein n=1 Tax=Spirosoma profusum TaxID=2771354 RepID=A0A926XXL6_9BACT|nr:hypothetical protein [Spirosoma profusum]MBD2699827.1 hypothetical protein [Spirosoma profusum]
MQPVKLSIYGDYLDCQLYRGRLYLWLFDNSLKVYDWYAIIESLIQNDLDRLTFEYCFLDGNQLYKSSILELIKKDAEFRLLFLNKFLRVANRHYEINEETLAKFLIGEQDTPTNDIPTDTEIYGNKLYFITEQGLFSSTAHARRDRNPVSSKAIKLWDCNLLSIKANKYPQIALSGGEQGLFELNMSKSVSENLKQVDTNNPIYQVSTEHSSFSNYTYLNLYNSSLISKSFMAKFKWDIHEDELTQQRRFIRNFDEEIDDNIIFEDTNKHVRNYISWGVDDTIFRANENTFEVVRYNNRAKLEKGEKIFTKLKNISIAPWKGKVLSGSTSYFGVVVECENALIVLLSDNSSHTIKGPVTRWRIYPRSFNYQNHLHVVLEDRLDIYSFNQDYFQEQDTKTLGLEYHITESNSTRLYRFSNL